jgi:hypothetical protein
MIQRHGWRMFAHGILVTREGSSHPHCGLIYVYKNYIFQDVCSQWCWCQRVRTRKTNCAQRMISTCLHPLNIIIDMFAPRKWTSRVLYSELYWFQRVCTQEINFSRCLLAEILMPMCLYTGNVFFKALVCTDYDSKVCLHPRIKFRKVFAHRHANTHRFEYRDVHVCAHAK